MLPSLEKIDAVSISMAYPRETVAGHVAHSMTLGFPEVSNIPDWREQAPIAIVGGGPSLKDTIGDLRGFSNIMACGSVHDHLVGSGIAPRWTVVCDPDPIVNDYLRLEPFPVPHIGKCIYLVASQCHPDTFKHLAGRRMAIWHCSSNSPDDNAVFGPGEHTLIGGGCTVGTRALALALAFGFSNLHLFGMDTCVTDEEHHAFSLSPKDPFHYEPVPLRLGDPSSGKLFKVWPYHVAQVRDFQKMLAAFPDRMAITVHGDGVLAELMRLGREKALAA